MASDLHGNITQSRNRAVQVLLAALIFLLPMSMGLGGCTEELFAHRDQAARQKALYFPDPHPIENYNRYGQPSNNPQNFSGGGGF
ncbi:MAG: hypothetical protein ACP5O1_02070 [Phycisphaerae bacterium]